MITPNLLISDTQASTLKDAADIATRMTGKPFTVDSYLQTQVDLLIEGLACGIAQARIQQLGGLTEKEVAAVLQARSAASEILAEKADAPSVSVS